MYSGGTRRTLVIVGRVTLIGLLLGACRSDEAKRPSTTTTLPPTVTSTTVAEGEAVLAAYRRFWDVYIAASNPMNPESPELAQNATGEELRTVQRTFLARKSAGEIFRGTIDLSPSVIEQATDRAVIRDCHDDNLVLLDAQTGAVKEPDDPVRKLVSVTLLREGGAWKVASIKLEAEGCAG